MFWPSPAERQPGCASVMHTRARILHRATTGRQILTWRILVSSHVKAQPGPIDHEATML